MHLQHLLPTIQNFTFEALGTVTTGWQGRGAGTVQIECQSAQELHWCERGSWTTAAGQTFPCQNRYRWHWLDQDRCELSHLRFGLDRPVLLCELQPQASNSWRAIQPHLCAEDRYDLLIVLQSQFLQMDWQITGPKKLEQIRYYYYW